MVQSIQQLTHKILDGLESTDLSFEDILIQIVLDNSKQRLLDFLKENQSDVIDQIIRDPDNRLDIVTMLNSEELSVNSQELIDELLKRYKNHDTDIKDFIVNLQLNNPKALIPRS